MSHYKDRKINLGHSDIAALVLRGCTALDELKLGSDGDYHAWLVTDESLIPAHYTRRFETDHWLDIYDDERKRASIRADHISVYTAGDFGILIYAENMREVLRDAIKQKRALPPTEYVEILNKLVENSTFTGTPSTYWGYLLDQAEKHVAILKEVMEGKGIEEVSPFPILRFHVSTGEVVTEWIEWADDMFSDDTEDAYTIWPHDPEDPHDYALDILAEYEYRFVSK